MNLSKLLSTQNSYFSLTNQVLRSGTAIGALIREAEFAESRKDFIHKLLLSLKEANETTYWLELLGATGLVSEEVYISMQADATELVRMLVASIKTARPKSTN